ncbi:MAG: DUF3306 domain-containing protein [Hyphomicrobiales bacterium]|nr:DUF3306 domain-containing protein [Hyphomicrobiales bacterium]
MTDPRETPLRRWSRLKRDRQAPANKPDNPLPEASPPLPDAPPAPTTAGNEPSKNDPSERAAQADHDVSLPDIDSLDRDSDFTVFMTETVPEELRRRALRTLWRSDPILANLDGLNDYDEDYSMVGTVRDVVRTVYEAGKGYLTEERGAAEEQQFDRAVNESELHQRGGSDEPVVAQDGGEAAMERSLEDEVDPSLTGEKTELSMNRKTSETECEHVPPILTSPHSDKSNP